ncbi:nitrile hydratase subunit beta [Ahrensia sp. R2A130]|uniref:nitrile hydratase subunit beta n=1 Tax=Ahrensia sp. R2A130 TaxID=744979 RepID=UPI0001E0BC96|nr:nitrile hydratase subunit beta [Ahrensia sp. R2A130]EFL88759.1 nitrile hydratase, beta subunit [Ahrensia sp. R2A130]
MNGGADLGGMMGFGPVVDSAEASALDPLFHADWEPRVLGMIVAIGAAGKWNLDQSRFARESLPPADYMRFPYYRIWLEAAQKLLLERQMITTDELEAGRMISQPQPIRKRLAREDVAAALQAGGPVDRPADRSAGFAVGDNVQTINIHPESHTRLPRYARGKAGVVTAILGFHVFPDSNALGAHGKGEDPQWLYQIRFSARELWGDDCNPRDSVTLDLWEPYLERG